MDEMSDQQPEALLLADKADKAGAHPIAAELRRLYWDEHRVRKHRDMLAAEVTKLHAEVAELLAALRTAADHLEGMPDPEDVAACVAKARAAIAKAEGKS
jgi:hypothetical protein